MNKLIIGETCLLAKQLRRLNIIDGPVNMFENVLVNIDIVRKIIENNFNDILNERYLEFKNYTYYPKQGIQYPKWINTLYSLQEDTIYSWPMYAPLFHHDEATQAHRDSYDRKIIRTKQLFECETPTTLFYYSRWHDSQDIQLIIKKYHELITCLQTRYNKEFKGVLLTNNTNDFKSLNISTPHPNLLHGHFQTTTSWVEADENWDGSSDNAMFDIFFERIKDFLIEK
jgi:hypothetical protein